MKKIFVGLGNPILSDDAVGILVLDALKEKAGNTEGLVFSEANSGGLALLDLINGFDEVVLIDSIITNQVEPGTLMILTPEDFSETRHISNLHDINFATALKVGSHMGYVLPSKFSIYAIEVKEVLEFGHKLTPEIEKRLPDIIEEIAKREL